MQNNLGNRPYHYHDSKRSSSKRQRPDLSYSFPFLAVIGILAITFFLFLHMATENIQAKADYEKSFIAVSIQAGDTLWGYAEKYADSAYYSSKQEYIREVCAMNGLESEMIYAGKTIALPVIRIKATHQ